MAANNRPKIHFESVEELLGAPVMKDGTEVVKIKDIHPFKDHPFKVLDDDKMDELVESIKANGVFSPVLIRPREEGGYEMISGHRRLHASEKAGLTSIPAIIKEMTDDEAVIAMVDSNVQREEILPSERAWSLKMKMDAMRRQGSRTDITSDGSTYRHDVEKLSCDDVGESAGICGRQVQRYVRLTNLIPEIMSWVDEKKISMVMAVDIPSSVLVELAKAFHTTHNYLLLGDVEEDDWMDDMIQMLEKIKRPEYRELVKKQIGMLAEIGDN